MLAPLGLGVLLSRSELALENKFNSIQNLYNWRNAEVRIAQTVLVNEMVRSARDADLSHSVIIDSLFL